MWHLTTKHLRRAVVGAAAVAVLAACSSGGGASGGSGGSGGSTITIGGAGPIASSVLSQPERQAAEEAAIAAVNAAGGVNGHKLKLDWCDTLDTANGEFTCMRQLVDDKVAAIVAPGLLVDQSGRGLKFAAAAGIPIVGGQGLSPIEFTTPGSFPMASGIPGWSYGQVVSLIRAGSKKIALFGTNEPGAQYILSYTEQAMKLAGLTPAHVVETDANADPTFAQGAAEAIAGGVDGIVFDASPTYADKAVQALRTAGYGGPIASITGNFTPASIKALGAAGDNLYLTSQMALTTDTSNPGVAAFLAGMRKYQPAAQTDETAMTAWTAVELFAAVAKTIKGDITGTSVLTVMNNLSTPVDLRTAGPYQVKNAVSSPVQGYPRLYNPTVVIGVVKNGILEPFSDGFVDPFTTLAKVRGS